MLRLNNYFYSIEYYCLILILRSKEWKCFICGIINYILKLMIEEFEEFKKILEEVKELVS